MQMIHLSLKKDSGTLGILTLRGNLVEHSTEELQAFLSRALDQVDHLIVNCDQVTAVDVSRLRLLCTTYRVSQVYKKEFTLSGGPETAFLSALETAGDGRCPGEHNGCEAGCLFAKKELGCVSTHASEQVVVES